MHENYDPNTIPRAVLVSLFTDFVSDKQQQDAVEELRSLAEAAGAEVVGISVQNRPKIDAATYIGKGKAEETAQIVRNEDASLVIFNQELSGSQIRNLEEIMGVKVIDRTLLILDIFAVRAESKIAKLQVDLAQQKYRLPRLVGFGGELSRTGAGIGTRGAGEQKLELDRRVIRRRINELEGQIKDAEKHRATQKSRRDRNNIPTVALVGYTNAGKSSLMNKILQMTDSSKDKEVFQKDMLFATLDTYARKIKFADKSEIILMDTVGFVSDLPHGLVSAFKSTLEVAADADLLVQVIDLTNVDREFQTDVTEQTLKQIGAAGIPMIKAYNKCDIADEIGFIGSDSALISAKTGEGIQNLIDRIKADLFASRKNVKMHIPFSEGAASSYLQEKYSSEVEFVEDGVYITASIDPEDYGRYKAFVIEEL